LEGLAVEDVGIFDLLHSHLVYFVVIKVHYFGYFIYFSRFGMLHQEKSGNPGWQEVTAGDELVRRCREIFGKVGQRKQQYL
jgi:hypothetical protein